MQNQSVQVSDIFNGILRHAMDHVSTAHGAKPAQHLFFELYNQVFCFLEREYGHEAVERFWESVADRELGPLEHLMRTKGFEGMAEFWRSTLEQEGAPYEMTVDSRSFNLRVKHCPPCEWFRARELQRYLRYCDHCRVLYQRVAERCGFAMEYFPPDEQAGVCCGLRFTRAKESQ